MVMRTNTKYCMNLQIIKNGTIYNKIKIELSMRKNKFFGLHVRHARIRSFVGKNVLFQKVKSFLITFCS